jgi:hypothetical protein
MTNSGRKSLKEEEGEALEIGLPPTMEMHHVTIAKGRAMGAILALLQLKRNNECI